MGLKHTAALEEKMVSGERENEKGDSREKEGISEDSRGEAEAREEDGRRKHMWGQNRWTENLFMTISVLKQKAAVNSQSTENKKSSDQLK